MQKAYPTLSTSENAEGKSTEHCFLASSSHQNISGNLLDVNTTAKQWVDLTKYAQEADVQDRNSSKEDQSSACNYKRLRNPCIQYQSCFRVRVIHDKEYGMSTANILQRYSSFGLDKSKISLWFKNKYTILKNAVGDAKNVSKSNQQRNTTNYLRNWGNYFWRQNIKDIK